MAIWVWDFDPSEWHEGVVTKTLISDMGGREKRGRKGTPRRTFEGKLARFSEDIGDVLIFFADRNGQTEQFTLYHPRTGEAIQVRFNTGDDIDTTHLYHVVASVGVKFIEVI